MKIPLKLPVAVSMLKTFKMAPCSLFQIDGLCAQDAAVDAIRRTKATVTRYMFVVSKLVVSC
jgi:hypothetical protein